MTNFATTSLNALRRLLSSTPSTAAPSTGDSLVLDGMSAVGMIESRISDSAGLGGTYPASIGARVWDYQTRSGTSASSPGLTSGSTSGVRTNSPRAALAAAMGLSMSGRRATVFLSGPDLSASHDLLALAAGQHLPLVVHVACRAGARHSIAIGSGHDAIHAAIDCGFFQLFAMDAQEAIDFALIARRVAERSLIPGLVAMDAEQTASTAQQVLLPDETLIATFLGNADAVIESPTNAQSMLLGASRRRVPRPFDIDAPQLLSPLQDRTDFALGAAASRPYFADHLQDILADAFAEFATLTGRHYATAFEHKTSDAEIVLVAQGAAVQTVRAFADYARSSLRTKVGVLGIRSLRPLPSSCIVKAISGAKVVAVLERTDAPMAADGPLLRELRAALNFAKVRDADLPTLVNVPFGIGGLPLRGADLVALLGRLGDAPPQTLYLGLDFVLPSSAYPKRQAAMDALRRRYPHVSELGVTGDETPPDLRPAGATSIAICRAAGRHYESLIADATSLAHALTGNHVTGKPDATWNRFGEPCIDELVCAPSLIENPCDDAPIDIAVIASDTLESRWPLHNRLITDGVLLVAADSNDATLARSLPEALKARCAAGSVALYRVPRGEVEGKAAASSSHLAESLLGGLLSLLLTRQNIDAPMEANLQQQRESMLLNVAEDVRADRINAFVVGFNTVQRVEVHCAGCFTSPATRPISAELDPNAPAPLIDELSNLWESDALFNRTGERDELAATPERALGALPPLSSTLNDVAAARTLIPVLDPETCDADPSLWMSCPDGSVSPLVISARSLINRGIELAGERSNPADALRAITGQLAKRVNKIVSSSETPAFVAADLLVQAFDGVTQKAADDDERQIALRAALNAVVNVVGDLTLVRTARFFDDPNNDNAGSGELFSLIVNPATCKCPELILAECGGRGLTLIEQTESNLAAARRLHQLWLTLPDTSGETIERARNNADIGPLAAIMLSRHCSLAMAGGDGSEPGSGAKLNLRLILGLAEYRLQPRQALAIAQIDETRQKLKSRIDQILADALPADNLDDLAERLESLGTADIDLASISTSLESTEPQPRIQKAPLSRSVDLARALADLRQQIAAGRFGLGRARSGIVIAPGSTGSWAGVSPFNPFQSPTVIDAIGESAPLAQGLLIGQIRHVLSGIRLLRRAQLELDDDASAPERAASLASLTYADLTDDERALCPPMFVICDARTFAQSCMATLTDLLGEKLPIKFVVLSGVGGSIDTGLATESFDPYPSSERFDLALLAMMARDMYVAQISPSHTDHFAQAALDAIAFDGPALLHVYTPSPDRHGFPRDQVLERARVAVRSRAFPLFSFDPSWPGVFGSRLDLSANQSVETHWGNPDEPTTPIDWALGEARFADGLRSISETAGSDTPVAEYLALSPSERSGKNPIANTLNTGESRVNVSPELIADADGRMKFWRTLQELAGIVTPFTERVQAEAQQSVADAHQTDLAALRAEYESKIASLRTEFDVEATARVTQGLMSLAGYAPESSNGGVAP